MLFQHCEFVYFLILSNISCLKHVSLERVVVTGCTFHFLRCFPSQFLSRHVVEFPQPSLRFKLLLAPLSLPSAVMLTNVGRDLFKLVTATTYASDCKDAYFSHLLIENARCPVSGGFLVCGLPLRSRLTQFPDFLNLCTT